MILPEAIRKAVAAGIPGAVAAIRDLTGTGDHYEVAVTAECFRGKPLLEQHRIVHRALEELMRGDLHAVQIKTIVPPPTTSKGVQS